MNANQEDLMKLNHLIEMTISEEQPVHDEPNIFTDQIEPLDKEEPDSDSDADWFDNCMPEATEKTEEIKVKPEPSEIQLPEVNLSNLTYFELLDLPINFTYSYRCLKCENSDKFGTRIDLRRHFVKVHFKNTRAVDREFKLRKLMKGQFPYCDICDVKVSSRGSYVFEDHKFFHYKLRPYQCGMEGCSHMCNSRRTLKRHIEFHLGGPRYRCSYCDERNFTTTDARENHIKEVHTDKTLDCRECGKVLTRPWEIKSHFKNHKSAVLYECERCLGGIKFSDERLLNLHKQRHIYEDKYPKQFCCNLCERCFGSENNFRKHIKNHQPTSEYTLFTCPECGKTVTRHKHENVSTHERLHKKNDGNFKCPQCDEVFEKQPKLRAHIRKEHSSKQTPCDRCGKLLFKHTLTKHLNKCVGGDFRCAHCPLIFDSKIKRYRHTQIVHIGFNCKKCRVQYANKSELNRHLKRDPVHHATKRKYKK